MLMVASPSIRRYEDLVTLCNMGLTHLTAELLKHRSLFEKNFSEAYAMSKRELSAKLSEVTVHERIFGNWVIPLATYRSLETVLDLPFSYAELFETAVKGVLNQNELAQESSEVGDFWNMLQGFQTCALPQCSGHRTAVQRSRQQFHIGKVLLVNDNVIPEISQPLSGIEAGQVCHTAS